MDKADNVQNYLIFISHSSEDSWVAEQIAGELQIRGISTFLFETDIEFRADFEEKLRDTLEKADELLVLLTPWALERRYVWLEIGAAWLRKIPIASVLHGLKPEKLQSDPNFPILLKKSNMITLNQISRYFDQLSNIR